MKKTVPVRTKMGGGETNGTVPFESPAMQKYLLELKPDKFADLIA